MTYVATARGHAGRALETFRWALVTKASIAYKFITRKVTGYMKPEYGSHGDRAKRAADPANRDEGIAHMRHKEIQARQEAPAETPEQIASAKPFEGCAKSNTEPEQVPTRLPGLSAAQTEFFYRLKERAAKHQLVLTVTPDGEMSAQERSGQSHSWGNIHDEVRVSKLITTMIDATLSYKEVTRLMFKLFPGSTKLGFLFESRGDN